MKHRTLFISISLFVIANLILAACGGAGATPASPTAAQGTTSEPTSAPAGQVVELKYFYRITSTSQEAFSKWVIDTFNEKYAGKIHVTGDVVDDETYKTKQAIVLASPTPPDVFFSWEGGRAKALIDAGFSAPLDDYYAKFGWEKILNPAGVALSVYDGKKYFVPWEMAAAVVWYRPDVYAKYGLSVPTTWDELAANAETLKNNGVAPFILTNQKRWPAQFEWTAILVNQAGLQTYQDLLANKIPWTDPRVVDAFATLKKMVDDGWYYPGINSMDLSVGVVPFSKGEVAMWYQGSWMPSVMKGSEDKIPFPVDFFPFPKIGDQDPVMEVFAENTVMIHAKSTHQDEAAEFVNYFISDEVQTQKLVQDRPFPANVNVDLSQLSPEERKLGEAMSNAGFFSFMHVDHAFDPAIANAFLDATQALVGGAMSPEEAAAATEAEAVRVRGAVK